MIRKVLLPATLLLLVACKNDRSPKKAEDAQDAGREFIRASLDGNYEKASFYLFPDSTNKQLFAEWKKMHERMSPDEQQKYKDASILPVDIHALNDSVTSYTFTNSYKKDTNTVLVVRANGEWLVDMKEILRRRRQ